MSETRDCSYCLNEEQCDYAKMKGHAEICPLFIFRQPAEPIDCINCDIKDICMRTLEDIEKCKNGVNPWKLAKGLMPKREAKPKWDSKTIDEIVDRLGILSDVKKIPIHEDDKYGTKEVLELKDIQQIADEMKSEREG